MGYVLLFAEFLDILNNGLRYAGEREAAIVKQILHGYHFGQIGKQGHAIICAGVSIGIA